MDLSAYSILPGYLNNMGGGMVVLAKANLALYQPAYVNSSVNNESLEQKITKGIQEGILAAFAQQQQATQTYNRSYNNNSQNYNNRNNNNNNNRTDDRRCYKCNKTGHISRDCRRDE